MSHSMKVQRWCFLELGCRLLYSIISAKPNVALDVSVVQHPSEWLILIVTPYLYCIARLYSPVVQVAGYQFVERRHS